MDMAIHGLGLISQALLVDGELLRHLGPRLPSKDVLELHI
jgi:hypothetical protein